VGDRRAKIAGLVVQPKGGLAWLDGQTWHSTIQEDRDNTEDPTSLFAQAREEVMNTLLTQNSTKEDFRKLYPFSPALVETLVAVSSVLQRERTALKVMAMLIVEQKDTLQLGQIVPVGDLFDQVSQGDEAFSADMRVHLHTFYSPAALPPTPSPNSRKSSAAVGP
jgi:hypothetical protein